jgi:hypothetical protein
MVQYTELSAEAPLNKETDDPHWPHSGEIKFSGATMKYREYLEPSVKDLSFEV